MTTVPIIAVSLRCLYDGIFPVRKPDLHQLEGFLFKFSGPGEGVSGRLGCPAFGRREICQIGINVLYLVMGHPLVMGHYFHFVKSNKTYNNSLTIYLEKLIFE